MTYNVFGGTLSFTQSINQSISPTVALRQRQVTLSTLKSLTYSAVFMRLSGLAEAPADCFASLWRPVFISRSLPFSRRWTSRSLWQRRRRLRSLRDAELCDDELVDNDVDAFPVSLRRYFPRSGSKTTRCSSWLNVEDDSSCGIILLKVCRTPLFYTLTAGKYCKLKCNIISQNGLKTSEYFML